MGHTSLSDEHDGRGAAGARGWGRTGRKLGSNRGIAWRLFRLQLSTRIHAERCRKPLEDFQRRFVQGLWGGMMRNQEGEYGAVDGGRRFLFQTRLMYVTRQPLSI